MLRMRGGYKKKNETLVQHRLERGDGDMVIYNWIKESNRDFSLLRYVDFISI